MVSRAFCASVRLLPLTRWCPRSCVQLLMFCSAVLLLICTSFLGTCSPAAVLAVSPCWEVQFTSLLASVLLYSFRLLSRKFNCDFLVWVFSLVV